MALLGFPYDKARGQIPTTTERIYSEGNCQVYVEDLRKRKGPDADQLSTHEAAQHTRGPRAAHAGAASSG